MPTRVERWVVQDPAERSGSGIFRPGVHEPNLRLAGVRAETRMLQTAAQQTKYTVRQRHSKLLGDCLIVYLPMPRTDVSQPSAPLRSANRIVCRSRAPRRLSGDAAAGPLAASKNADP